MDLYALRIIGTKKYKTNVISTYDSDNKITTYSVDTLEADKLVHCEEFAFENGFRISDFEKHIVAHQFSKSLNDIEICVFSSDRLLFIKFANKSKSVVYDVATHRISKDGFAELKDIICIVFNQLYIEPVINNKYLNLKTLHFIDYLDNIKLPKFQKDSYKVLSINFENYEFDINESESQLPCTHSNNCFIICFNKNTTYKRISRLLLEDFIKLSKIDREHTFKSILSYAHLYGLINDKL